MAWGVVNVVVKREEFSRLVIENELTMAEACRQFEISRPTGYKWIKRYLDEGKTGLENRSKAPINQPRKVDIDREQIILKARFKKPSWGPKKIRAMLVEKYPEIDWPSKTTIGSILHRNGLVPERTYRRRVPGKTVPLSDQFQPNDTWAADFKGWFSVGDGRKCEPFTLSDGATRFILKCQSVDVKDVEHIWAILETAFREYGLPLFLRTDNGPPFATCGAGRMSLLSVRLVKAGVIPEWIEPGKPQQNGRHERMHRTLKLETASPPAETLEEQIGRFRDFVRSYNFERPHEAIGLICPGSIYRVSERRWTGKLKEPEYPSDFLIRKVKSCGKLSWKCEDLYIGRTLSGEPLGMKEQEDGTYTVYYGPIILGTITRKKQFEVPQSIVRRR